MTKTEYKRISHDIRYDLYTHHIPFTYSTRAKMHNVEFLCIGGIYDKCGRRISYNYRCFGDYDIGLVWRKGR